MKQLLIFCFLAFSLIGCEKDDDSNEVIEFNSVAEDIQAVMASENVELILVCPIGSTCCCGTDDFAFIGDNILRVLNKYYNLNYVLEFGINTNDDGEKIMNLRYLEE